MIVKADRGDTIQSIWNTIKMNPIQSHSSIHSAISEIDTLIRARYPILYLLTHEEARLEALLVSLARKQNKPLFIWTVTSGLKEYQDAKESDQSGALQIGGYSSPIEILNHIQSINAAAIFLLKDFHPYLEDPHVVRRMRDVANDLKNTYKTLILVSPKLNLPMELEKEITLIDIPMPDANEMMSLLKSICTTVVKKNNADVKLNIEEAWSLVRAAQGLTLTEAENAFAKALVDDSIINIQDISLVLKEKQQIIRKSGILEFYPSDSDLSQVGGLDHLKHWLMLRGKAFSTKAADFGLPAPKGVLLLGAPGCGKSLTAKAIASTWQMPLLRLDFGKIFSGYIGSSEENMRRALKVAESIAPTILWIDEIEKGLAGGASGQSDGGTATRVFGTFLTWMQEKTSKVFVVATANKIEALPPELLRRGRFDEIFFMDLPQASVREEIAKIHLSKRDRQVENYDIKTLVTVTKGFSGAEIEHVVVEGLFKAYYENRELKTEDLLKAAGETIPLSTTYAEELAKTRAWAKNRARPADDILSEKLSLSVLD